MKRNVPRPKVFSGYSGSSSFPRPTYFPDNEIDLFQSGLEFTQIALTRSQKDKNEELDVSFTKAYGVTLKKYHSFVVKPIFAVRPSSLSPSTWFKD